MSGVGSRTWRASWRVALRLARRDVLRSKGRTTLVAVMVGVPVMLVVALSTLVHTNDISPKEGLAAAMGQTQGVVTMTGDSRQAVSQGPAADGWSSQATDGDSSLPTSKPWTVAQIQSLTGGRLLPIWTGETRLSSGDIGLPIASREIATNDPQTSGMLHAASGRLPRTASEVAITPGLARLTGWKVGTTLSDLDTKATQTVVGTFSTLGQGRNDRGVLGLPGALHVADDDSVSNGTFLLVRDRPVTWPEIQRLNTHGVVVLSREVVEHPPSKSQLTPAERDINGDDAATRAVLVLVIVAIVIEVVLLAGPAFAVGVRRRRRDLALLAATGSTPRDIRRSVLAQALVVGVGSATVGAVLGLPLAALAIPVTEHFGAGVGPFDWRWQELLTALVVGGLATLIAALAPAVAASRSDVASVLAGRRGTLHSRRGWPLLGLALIGAGTAGALTRGTRAGGELYVAGGTIVIVLGAVAATPWLVGQVGRLARRLPLPLRLATRDAARQRSRTAPAVAAIMASVIGITALAIGFASDHKQARRDYEPRTAYGVATVSTDRDNLDAVTQTVKTILPGRTLSTAYDVESGSITPGATTTLSLSVVSRGCTVAQTVPSNTSTDADSDDSSCPFAWEQASANHQVAGVEPAALAGFGVKLDAHQRSVLDDGGVLLAVPSSLRGDHAVIAVSTTKTSDGSLVGTPTLRTLPAALLPSPGPRTSYIGDVLMTPATATSLGISLNPTELAVGGALLTHHQEDQLSEKLTVLQSSVYVERGFHQPYGLVLSLLALIGGLVVLVGTITATGLAMSEARPDLATLAAIGAPPRTRRLVASAQAVVIGLMGTVLGVALGFVPGLAVTWPLTANSYTATSGTPGSDAPTVASGPVIAIPWLTLLVVVLAVPLVAGLVTGLFTRSRLPMVRRLAT